MLPSGLPATPQEALEPSLSPPAGWSQLPLPSRDDISWGEGRDTHILPVWFPSLLLQTPEGVPTSTTKLKAPSKVVRTPPWKMAPLPLPLAQPKWWFTA